MKLGGLNTLSSQGGRHSQESPLHTSLRLQEEEEEWEEEEEGWQGGESPFARRAAELNREREVAE